MSLRGPLVEFVESEFQQRQAGGIAHGGVQQDIVETGVRARVLFKVQPGGPCRLADHLADFGLGRRRKSYWPFGSLGQPCRQFRERMVIITAKRNNNPHAAAGCQRS